TSQIHSHELSAERSILNLVLNAYRHPRSIHWRCTPSSAKWPSAQCLSAVSDSVHKSICTSSPVLIHVLNAFRHLRSVRCHAALRDWCIQKVLNAFRHLSPTPFRHLRSVHSAI